MSPCDGEVGLPCVVGEANNFRSRWVENEEVLPPSFNSWKLPVPTPPPPLLCMHGVKETWAVGSHQESSFKGKGVFQ